MTGTWIRLRAGKIIWAALVAGAIWLGVRSGQSVALVLEPQSPVATEADPETDRFTKLDRIVGERQKRLGAVQTVARDPFRKPIPPAPAPVINADRAQPVAPTPPVPKLRAWLFDNLKPAVQISVGRKNSGWLAPGDKFSGWTVAHVGPEAVIVTNGLRRIELKLKLEDK